MERILTMLAWLVALTACQTLYCNYNGMGDVKIGDRVYVCLHLSNGKRIAFPVKVDDYTGIKPTGVYDALRPGNTGSINSSVTLQFQSTTTKSGYLYNGGSQQVSNMYSFVIRTDKGKVLGIDSDNSNNCQSGCSGDCRQVQSDKNCYHAVNETTTSENDPKIFISWMGTDSSGNYMLSQTKRISRFTEYSVGNVYQDALNIFK